MADSREDMLRMLAHAQHVVKSRQVQPQSSGSSTAGTSGESHRTMGEALGYATDLSGAKKASKSAGGSGGNLLNANDNLTEFVAYYYSVLSKFCTGSQYELKLPDLSGQDRRVLHLLAEECNLSHNSTDKGSSSSRTLVVTKDTLFYRNPKAYEAVDLKAVEAKASGKESKFHLKRVQSVDPAQVSAGAIGSYADEDALRKIERFQRATDEYRHAVEIGYGQEEVAATSGTDPTTRVEDILSRPLAAPSPPQQLALTSNSTGGSHTTTTASAHANTAAVGNSSLSSAEKVYEEVCRGCGTHAPLDYDVSKWRCSKYCAQCTRTTIWSLEEKSGLVLTPRRSPAKRSDMMIQSRKHAREDDETRDATLPASVAAAVQPEEIDKDDDDQLADQAPLSVEDVVEAAAMNDFPAEDINWLRRFATHHAEHVQNNIMFCIEFSDVSSDPTFRRYDGAAQRKQRAKLESNSSSAAADEAVVYVVVRQSVDLKRSVTSLLEEVCKAAMDNNNSASYMDHIGLAFVNASVYGSEATVLCQLRPRVESASSASAAINREALLHLQKQYGSAHCFVTDSLNDAITHAMQ